MWMRSRVGQRLMIRRDGAGREFLLLGFKLLVHFDNRQDEITVFDLLLIRRWTAGEKAPDGVRVEVLQDGGGRFGVSRNVVVGQLIEEEIAEFGLHLQQVFPSFEQQ